MLNTGYTHSCLIPLGEVVFRETAMHLLQGKNGGQIR